MRDKITEILKATRHSHTASISAKGEAQIEQFLTQARFNTAGVGIFDAHKLTESRKVPKTETANVKLGDMISEDTDIGSKTFAAICEVTITLVEQTAYTIILLASSSKVRKALDRVIGKSLKWAAIAEIPQEIDEIPTETGPK